MARHLAPFSCRQTIAEIVRRRSWGGVLPLGRHASISGSRSIHAPSVSIALSSFQEGQNARLHNRFKREQALVLSGIICLGAGVMNIIPWGGPTVRAMAALKADASVIFNPVVPAMLVGIRWVLGVAWLLGRRERARVGAASLDDAPAGPRPASLSAAVVGENESDGSIHAHAGERKIALERPWLYWFNAALTVALVVAL